jgi:hypothetical protein
MTWDDPLQTLRQSGMTGGGVGRVGADTMKKSREEPLHSSAWVACIGGPKSWRIKSNLTSFPGIESRYLHLCRPDRHHG